MHLYMSSENPKKPNTHSYGTSETLDRSPNVDELMSLLRDSFQPHYGPGFDSASNRNEYQESSCVGKGRPARKTDILTTSCKSII
jgi:hypothetical protein